MKGAETGVGAPAGAGGGYTLEAILAQLAAGMAALDLKVETRLSALEAGRAAPPTLAVAPEEGDLGPSPVEALKARMTAVLGRAADERSRT